MGKHRPSAQLIYLQPRVRNEFPKKVGYCSSQQVMTALALMGMGLFFQEVLQILSPRHRLFSSGATLAFAITFIMAAVSIRGIQALTDSCKTPRPGRNYRVD